jgi:hypothetical protein
VAVTFAKVVSVALPEILVTLFREVFEGTPQGADGTWFVQGGEALEESLRGLNADIASVQPAANVSSIAAHVLHMTYYLRLSNAHARGQALEADWEGSWRKQIVSAEEWSAAILELRVQNDQLLELMHGDLNEEAILGAIANIGHAAYHLGAIRQLFLIVKPE